MRPAVPEALKLASFAATAKPTCLGMSISLTPSSSCAGRESDVDLAAYSNQSRTDEPGRMCGILGEPVRRISEIQSI